MQEDPRINRFMSGYFLWNTGIDGIFPYVYEAVRNNPYDDFDIWSDRNHDYRDHLVTYPSQEGPVPTIQWEALREGIDDYRHLQTWKSIKEQAETDIAKQSEAVINLTLEKYRDYNNMTKINISVFAADREIILSEITKLLNSFHPADTHEPYGYIDSGELRKFIKKWKDDPNIILSDVSGALRIWKSGQE